MAKQSPECLSETWNMDTIPPAYPKEAAPAHEAQKEQTEVCILGRRDPKPEFEGGEAGLLKYITESIRYPEIARRDSIAGKVIVQFVIDENGQVGEANILRGIGGGCDEEALRIAKSTSGKWKPGKQGGRAVKVWYTIPINFKLKSATGALASSANPADEDKIFRVVEERPEFEGGEAALLKYIAENIKYPDIARETTVEGKVIIQFVIDESGKVSHVNVIRGIGGGCDQEAIRIVNTMSGKWRPGKQDGRFVKAWYTLPVSFKLT